jgi:hypothetical protein
LNDICHGRAGAEVIQPMLEAFEVCFYMTEIMTAMLVAGHHTHNCFSISTIAKDFYKVPFFYFAGSQNFTFQKRKLTDYKIIMRDDFVDLENEVRNLLPKQIANVDCRPSAEYLKNFGTSEYPGIGSHARYKLSGREAGGLACGK